MNNMNLILRIFLTVLMPAALLAAAFDGGAQAQECQFDICKSAEDSGDTDFDFIAQNGELGQLFSLVGEGEGSCFNLVVPVGEVIEVFELPMPGWSLADIECNLTGADFEIVEGGVLVECLTPSAFGECIFTNVPGNTTRNIPTLSEWGMIAAAAGLGLVGVFFAVRRRRLQAGA